MTRRRDRTLEERAAKISFRLPSPYPRKLARTSDAMGLSPNQLSKTATMAFADGLLEFNERMKRIEDELQRLRRDFNDAVEP